MGTRRRVLAAVSASIGALAGCLTGSNQKSPGGTGTKTNTTSPTPTDEHTIVPGPCPEESFPVRVWNYDDRTHAFGVTITDEDGSEVLAETFEIEATTGPSDGTQTDVELAHEESYAFEVDLDGEHALTEQIEVECGRPGVYVTEDGEAEVHAFVEQE